MSRLVRPSVAAVIIGAVILVVGNGPCRADDEAIATIAVISNPYITTLPAEQIEDENGRLRGFLAKTGPESMERAVALVKQIKPDAFVVLGSLTWSGSNDDFKAMAKYLSNLKTNVNEERYEIKFDPAGDGGS